MFLRDRLRDGKRPARLGLAGFGWVRGAFGTSLIPDQSKTMYLFFFYLFEYWLNTISASFVSQLSSYALPSTYIPLPRYHMALSCHHKTSSVHNSLTQQVIRTPELPWHMVPHGLQPLLVHWLAEGTSLSTKSSGVLYIQKGKHNVMRCMSL